VTRLRALRGRPLQLALSGVLGAGAALLVACGSSSSLIPADNASRLNSDFDAVAAAVANGSCDQALKTAVAQTGSDLAALPPTVDPRLASALQDGVRTLTTRAAVECTPQTTTTQTNTNTTPVTTTTDTNTNPTTNTTPTDTTTTQTNTTTTPTTTTPTDTQTGTTTTPPPTTTPTTTGPAPDNGGGTPAPNGQTGQVGLGTGSATAAGGTGYGGGN
jgi:hypothetical protein